MVYEGIVVMSETATTRLFIDAQMLRPSTFEVPGGQVSVFGRGSPDKTGSNEDSMAVLSYRGFLTVLAVADGLGGTREGARASALAVRSLDESIDAAATDGTSPRTAILNGLEAANQSIQARVSGSATTVVVATIAGDFLRAYHVGDSGLLQIGQRGRIKQQTVAHSPVGFAQASGMLTEEEALYHAERHFVSNSIGIPSMSIEVGPSLRLARYDTVVLASDGLFDNLRLQEIVALVRKGPLGVAAENLVESIRRRMANEEPNEPSKPDDLSFILYRRTR